jgi:hypothetical protein
VLVTLNCWVLTAIGLLSVGLLAGLVRGAVRKGR